MLAALLEVAALEVRAAAMGALMMITTVDAGEGLLTHVALRAQLGGYYRHTKVLSVGTVVVCDYTCSFGQASETQEHMYIYTHT